MDLQEEIKLLEHKVKLLKQVKELQDAINVAPQPVYIPYPVYPPQPTYPAWPPWEVTYTNDCGGSSLEVV